VLIQQEWADPAHPMPKNIACWFCKGHRATVGFWENSPNDISRGLRPRPACACCCNRKGLEWAMAQVVYQTERIPRLEGELDKDCADMEVY
jgi:hypothetical protein